MASFHLSMPDDMREFIHRRAREGGFGTPTEYVRSLIREDRRRADDDRYGPLILKWLTEGELSDKDRESLPPEMLGRIATGLQRMLQAGVDSGPGREMTTNDLEEIRGEAIRRSKVQSKDA